VPTSEDDEPLDRGVPGAGARRQHERRQANREQQGKVAIQRPLFGDAKLTIAGRDKTALVHNLAKQVGLVTAALADVAPGVEVRGALCFVDAELPLLGRLRLDGYSLVHPKGLVKLMRAGAPVRTTDETLRIARQLAKRFPVA
jgi:hypothetical protein